MDPVPAPIHKEREDSFNKAYLYALGLIDKELLNIDDAENEPVLENTNIRSF
jgi:hypothetical protein